MDYIITYDVFINDLRFTRDIVLYIESCDNDFFDEIVTEKLSDELESDYFEIIDIVPLMIDREYEDYINREDI